jgi:Taurine catabolism dioxygenase TauD, TfdA family
MTRAVPFDELTAAAAAVTTTFEDAPSGPVEVADPYSAHGFAVVALRGTPAGEDTLLTLSAALGLGEPFVPPLYRLGGGAAPTVSRISAASNAETADADHPSFGRTVGQEFHCDGTLQDIGFVKATVLLCELPAPEGGKSLLFNASAAFARLIAADPAAAVALATPGTLVRQANINGSSEQNAGPVFTVQDGRLVARYCVTDTDRWEVPAGVVEADLRRGIEFLRRAALPGSPDHLELTLGPGEAIVFDNTRLSHGRSAYRDSPDRRRCLYRSLHLAHPSGVTIPAAAGAR